MTIRRQYSLPNCTLILEGLSDGTSTTGQPDPRPLMSILVNAECYLAGQEKPLTGGRDFLESLVASVSSYAQEVLSGVPQPQSSKDKPADVRLQKGDRQNWHRLIVQPHSVHDAPVSTSLDQGGTSGGQTAVMSQAKQVDLTTVQVFDLVEAVDQFLADSRTLPDISVRLRSVPKRYAVAHEPMVKRATPIAIGAGSLAACAIALSFVPVPKVKPPQNITPQPSSSPTATPSPSPAASAPQPSVSPVTAATAASNGETISTSKPEITDPTQLRFLQRKVYSQVNKEWNNRSELKQNLVYRVSVGQDGAIVGYKPVNKSANNRADTTPLPKLLYIPPTSSSSTTEPLAQFKMVFTGNGALEVSPWWGYTKQPDLGAQITDSSQINSLKQQLYDEIQKSWQEKPSYKRNLVYRVAVNKDGAIADYEPTNQPAFDYIEQTPLPGLVKSNNSTGVTTQEPLAQFQVIFKPSRVLEVSRW